MPEWECKNCGRSLESDLEPRECPCGNTDIEAREQLSMLEKKMQKFFEDSNGEKTAES